MSPLNDSSSSFLTAALPTGNGAKIVLVTFTLACFAYIIRVISPVHLTGMLVSSLAAVEHSYMQVVESGSFIGEYTVLAERLASLQVDVSLLREAVLRDSLSRWAPFSQSFKFHRTLAILCCIREVQALKTDIEILKEFQLRELPLETETAAARTISMRRRL